MVAEQTIQQLASVLHIEFIRGDDIVLPLTLRRDGGDGELVPIDITGWQFSAQVRAKVKDDAVLATWSVATGDDPTTGELTLALTGEQTAAISKVAYYDLQVTFDDRRRTWVRGELRPILDVTRDE